MFLWCMTKPSLGSRIKSECLLPPFPLSFIFIHSISFCTSMIWKNTFITIIPFIFLIHVSSMDVFSICTFPFHYPYLFFPLSLPTVFSGATIDSLCILRHIWTSLPSFPVSPLFQSTCDTLRSHSDSLGFAPNVLPSHPTLGNFEEFACWRRRQRGQLASDGKLWFRLVYMYISTHTVHD